MGVSLIDARLCSLISAGSTRWAAAASMRRGTPPYYCPLCCGPLHRISLLRLALSPSCGKNLSTCIPRVRRTKRKQESAPTTNRLQGLWQDEGSKEKSSLQCSFTHAPDCPHPACQLTSCGAVGNAGLLATRMQLPSSCNQSPGRLSGMVFYR